MAQGNQREEIPVTRLYEPIAPCHSGAYVAILTIIQALALAVLLNETRPLLTNGFSLSMFSRAVIVFLVILVVWHRYITETQFIWPIRWPDTVVPFLFGVLQWFFAMGVRKEIPFWGFALVLVFVSFLGVVAYINAICQRGRERTRNIFLATYPQAPIFAETLHRFLLAFDRRSAKWLISLTGIYGITVFLGYFLYYPFYEWLFPVIYVFTLFLLERYIGFYRDLEHHETLGQYFR